MNILDSKRLGGSKVQVLWIALPLALVLPGCPIYSDNGQPLPCSVSNPCPTGLTCVGGVCEGATCTSDRQCTSDEHCENGSCVPGQRVCLTHGDCDVGYMCDVQVCEVSTTCSTDTDCVGSPAGAGAWCDFRNTCVPHGANECRTSADCQSGNLCIEGQCTPLDSTCQFDHDCPAGSTCVNAECTAVCSTDADCVAGDVCSASHHCEAQVDCETSATCASGEHCVGGRCLVDCHGTTSCPSAGTRSTSYCGNDQFCHPSWQPHITCNLDTDCAAGRVCLSHVCRTPCPTMTDNECSTIDSQLPHCQLDTASSRYLCVADGSTTPECRTSDMCTGTNECINAMCQ
ncbi:MAG: hypothetical protein U0234_11850 [Sandaracinus sp.]